MVRASDQLRQRADYTHKFNTNTGRHGWLRLTPAHSVKVVEEIIARYGSSLTIFDPFCGTGTTALSAVNHGHDAVTMDINPFLIWLARTKVAYYSVAEIAEADNAGQKAVDLVWREAVQPAPEPPMYKIERWWPERARWFLCHLKSAIGEVGGPSGPIADLLKVAFCRTLMKLSNAAFNHQSMSFKDHTPNLFEHSQDHGAVFLEDLAFVLGGASANPSGDASLILGDARNVSACLTTTFDIVVTSPPYANRMSYIRELRPYMYWLEYLVHGRDAADLDWLAIGGTWGAATSRLTQWTSGDNWWVPADLQLILAGIAHSSNVSSTVLANYVAKYFEDISIHFHGLQQVLNPGSRVHYIVGNSTFYGTLVPTDYLYAAMLRYYGFADVYVRPIRKRNSKKELFEFEVSATWEG